MPELDLVSKGMTTCQGCAMELIARSALEVLGPKTITMTPPSCSAIITGNGDETGWGIPCVQTVLMSLPAFASGVSEAPKIQGKNDVNVMGYAGDGGTFDIGFQALSGAIERAVASLVAMQNESGAFCRTPGAQRYNHAFAAYALLSLPDGLLRTPAVQAACNRAIDYAQRTQTPQGAWDYTDDGSGNTALSTWQLAVLMQARLRGWPDDEGHLRRGLAWLRQQTDGHAFGYRTAGAPLAGRSGVTLTAMAASTLLEAARTYPTLQPEAVAAVSALNTLRDDVDVDSEDYYRDYSEYLAAQGIQ